MDELRGRCARSVGGLSLDLFVEVECARGPLFFDVGSGCMGPTILASHAAEVLGLGAVEPGTGGAVDLPLRGTAPIPTPWVVADVIHDGILGLSVLNRSAPTLDLAEGRAWLAQTT